MGNDYNAGKIVIETRLDNSGLIKSLNQTQRKILQSANVSENVFKNMAANIKNLFKNTSGLINSAANQSKEKLSKINKQINSSKVKINDYTKTIEKIDKAISQKGNKKGLSEKLDFYKQLVKTEKTKLNENLRLQNFAKESKSKPNVNTDRKSLLSDFNKNYIRSSRGFAANPDIESIKNKLTKILELYNITYTDLENREHENLLKRKEISEQEFLHLQEMLQMSKERVDIAMLENQNAFIYFKDYLKTGVTGFSNVIGTSLITAIRQGKNAFQTFGQLFVQLVNKMIDRLILLIAKLLVMKTLTSVFGGAGIFGKLFGFNKGGGINTQGKIYKASTGMYVNSGTNSTADDVPVLLSRGEGVLNARVTSMLGGEPAIKALNNLGRIKTFSSGGVTGGDTNNVTNINVQGSVIDTTGLLELLNDQAQNSGMNSLYNTGGIV